MQWWGATLHRQADGAKDAEGRVGYILLYDPNPSVGFDAPTEQCVTFLDDHELFDFEYDDFLPWRREGEGWEPSEDPNSDVVLDESGRILHDVSKSNEIEAKYTR